MPTPGWYPDPSTPSRLRYWDGQAWTEQTADQPPSAPASPPAGRPPSGPPPSYTPQAFTPSSGSSWVTPPPSPSYAAGPGGGAAGPGSGPSGHGRGKVALLVSLVVVLVVLVATGGFFGVRALTGDSDDDSTAAATDSPTDETTDAPSGTGSSEPAEPSPSESESGDPSPDPSEGAFDEACVSGSPQERQDHPQDGDLYGGGLRIPRPAGYQGYPGEPAYTFASDVTVVATDLPGAYIATYALGSVSQDAFPTLQDAAQQVVLCIVDSEDFYPPDARLSLGDTAATEVDGLDAWSATARVRIQGAEIPGGIVRAMVVDTGDDDTFGLFVAIMPIGDDDLVFQRDRVIRALTAD